MQLLRFFTTIIFLSFLLSIQCTEAPGINKFTVINNVRIFNGEYIIPQGTVVISNGKIHDVGKEVSIPDGAEVINGKGKTLLPGLIDAHVHISDEQDLKQFLIFGVTTVVDMGMDAETMQRIKKQQSSMNSDNMASMISAGTLVTAPGGHGTEYFSYIPTIAQPEEAQAFVDERIAEGSDFIKIIYDDGSSYNIAWPTLNKETLSAVIKAVHRNNKLVVVHIAKLHEARWTIEAGASGLAHLFYNDAYDPEFGNILAQHKAFVIPTLSVLESLSGTSGALTLLEDSHLSPYFKQNDIEHLKQAFPVMTGVAGYKAAEKTVQQLKKADVPILAGTDAPNPGTARGISLHRELKLLVQAGLTPIEALKAATSTPASIFNFMDRGQIKPGFYADLLLVNGDPTENIQATRDIVAVWKNGVRVDRESYRETIEKENSEKVDTATTKIAKAKIGKSAKYNNDAVTTLTDSLKQGIQLYKDGKYPEATAYLESYLTNNQNSHMALYYLGKIYSEEEKCDDAIEWLKRAVALDENNSKYHYSLGLVYKKQMDNSSLFAKKGLIEKIIEEFERVLEIKPDHIDARFMLAGIYMTVPGFLGGSNKKAKQHAEELKKYDAFLGCIILGDIHRREKEFDLAQQEFISALHEYKNNISTTKEVWRIEIALKDLGNDYLNTGNVPKAIKIFKIYVIEFPQSFLACHKLAEAYMKNGDKKLAIATFKKSLELNPQKEEWEKKLYDDAVKKTANIDKM